MHHNRASPRVSNCVGRRVSRSGAASLYTADLTNLGSSRQLCLFCHDGDKNNDRTRGRRTARLGLSARADTFLGPPAQSGRSLAQLPSGPVWAGFKIENPVWTSYTKNLCLLRSKANRQIYQAHHASFFSLFALSHTPFCPGAFIGSYDQLVIGVRGLSVSAELCFSGGLGEALTSVIHEIRPDTLSSSPQHSNSIRSAAPAVGNKLNGSQLRSYAGGNAHAKRFAIHHRDPGRA